MASYFRKIRKKWQLIAYVSLVLGAVTFFVSTLVPPKYRSDITLLVVQRNIDTLSASRSVEYLDEVFSQVLYTESFMNDVLASPLDIHKRFSLDPKKRKNQWVKEINVTKIENAGMLQISVFDTSRLEAEKIAGGIGWNFVNNGNMYHGGAGNIEVKIIDGPITSSKPSYPNVFVNALVGFLAGLLGSLVLVYFFDGFDIRVFNSGKKPTSIVEREIQRQLEKRSQQTDLKYSADSQEIYSIKKPSRNASRQSKAEKTKSAEPEIEKKEKTNFFTKLYQKSLFSDESTGKKESHEEVALQQKSQAREEDIEHVKKISLPEDDLAQRPSAVSGPTAPAPENLPIFLSENEEPADDKENKKEIVEEAADQSREPEDIQEPTEDEVKDRLNKLLKGEL